jgi:hypothetical protein
MLLVVSSSPEIHKIAQQQETNRRVAKVLSHCGRDVTASITPSDQFERPSTGKRVGG